MTPSRPPQALRPAPRGALPVLVAALLGLACGAAPGTPADERPDIEEGIAAWFSARSMVDDLHIPPAGRDRIGIDEPEFRAVSVIIRFRGQIIGVGDAADLGSETLYVALREAVRNARRSPKVRELPIEMISSVGRGSTIELELAGEPSPVLGRTIEDVGTEIRPGIDGLALRRDDQWSYVFPGRMQAFGQADRPTRSLIRLMREAGLPPRSPAELRQFEDIGIYRFQTLTLTQDAPGAPPHESVRSARRVFVQSPEEVTDTAVDLATGCLGNIRARLASDPDKLVGDVPGGERLIALGLFGDYDFVRNEFEPLIASANDQALAAWAVARYALNAPGLANPGREELARFAVLILERLEIVDSVEDPPLDSPEAAALVTLATLDLEQLGRAIGIRLLLPRITEQAEALLVEQAGREAGQDEAGSNTMALRNLAATALERARPGSIPGEVLAKLDERTWSMHDERNLAGSLPWLLMAGSAAPVGEDSERWSQVVEAIDALVAAQIGHSGSLVASTPPVEDLVGGFVTRGATRTTADSSSLRPAYALAIVLRTPPGPLDPSLREAWSEATRRSLRFVDQIQVNPGQLHRAPGPERARGGIKRAPWSNEIRLRDTSLALLLATELLTAPDGEPGTVSVDPDPVPTPPEGDVEGNPGGGADE